MFLKQLSKQYQIDLKYVLYCGGQESFISGSSVLKLLDPNGNYQPNDLDIFIQLDQYEKHNSMIKPFMNYNGYFKPTDKPDNTYYGKYKVLYYVKGTKEIQFIYNDGIKFDFKELENKIYIDRVDQVYTGNKTLTMQTESTMKRIVKYKDRGFTIQYSGKLLRSISNDVHRILITYHAVCIDKPTFPNILFPCDVTLEQIKQYGKGVKYYNGNLKYAKDILVKEYLEDNCEIMKDLCAICMEETISVIDECNHFAHQSCLLKFKVCNNMASGVYYCPMKCHKV